MTRMTENGCSTTKTPGQEQYEKYSYGIGKRKKYAYQYDYRDIDGELFSCCAPTIQDCRNKRNAWLERKYQNN